MFEGLLITLLIEISRMRFYRQIDPHLISMEGTTSRGISSHSSAVNSLAYQFCGHSRFNVILHDLLGLMSRLLDGSQSINEHINHMGTMLTQQMRELYQYILNRFIGIIGFNQITNLERKLFSRAVRGINSVTVIQKIAPQEYHQ